MRSLLRFEVLQREQDSEIEYLLVGLIEVIALSHNRSSRTGRFGDQVFNGILFSTTEKINVGNHVGYSGDVFKVEDVFVDDLELYQCRASYVTNYEIKSKVLEGSV